MSRLAVQSRQSAIAFSAFILFMSLISAVAWKLERVLSPSISVLSATRLAAPSSSARVASDYGRLPIGFELNQGQTDKSVQFLARGAGYTLFLTPGEAVLALHAQIGMAGRRDSFGIQSSGAIRSQSGQRASRLALADVRLKLAGSNAAAQAVGTEPLPGRSNYFVGNDPSKWQTDVPTYAKVRYHDIYPGIDLIYYGNQEGRLEHDFVVAPGADPKAIVLTVQNANKFLRQQNGDLTFRTRAGDVTLANPAVYQIVDGKRRMIPAAYDVASNKQIRFQLGAYDTHSPLVIDPVLVYTAVFGGSRGSLVWAMALDGSGSTYVAGYTDSIGFPTVNAFQTEGSGTTTQVFVSKINAAGTALLYSTYLGRDGGASGIAVDAAGRAYVVGNTGPGLPVKNANQPVGNGSSAFLTAFGPAGNTLVFSTYLGNGPGFASAVASDAVGNTYTTGVVSKSPGGGIFVTKFNSAGALQYSKFMASGFNEVATAIAVDASGAAYITGSTYNPDIPVTANAFQSACRACPNHTNAFVTKLSPSGASLIYSTYLGSLQGNGATGIAVDSAGNAYIAGYTGYGFPTTSKALQRTFRGGLHDGFITRLNASGTALLQSTYLGGNATDIITGIALDRDRTVYVAGDTMSPNFPLKASLESRVSGGKQQKFVTVLSGSLDSISYYSTYLGTGSFNAREMSIAVDHALNVYLGSSSDGVDMVPTPGALARYPASSPVNAMVTKLVIMDDLELGISASPSLSVTHGSNLTYTLDASSRGPDFGVNVRIDDPLPAGATFVSYAASRGTCTAPAAGATGTLHCALQQLDKGDTFTVTLTVKVNAAAGSTLSNTAAAQSNMQDFHSANNKATYISKVN